MLELPSSFLTLPSASDGSARVLQRKVRLIALRELLTFSAEALGPKAGRSVAAMQTALQRVLKHNPDAILQAVGSPDVLVPLLAMASGLRTPLDVAGSMMRSLFASLACRGVALDEALLWDLPFERLNLHGRGEMALDPPGKSLLVDATGMALELADGRRIDLISRGSVTESELPIVAREIPVGPANLGLHLSLYDSNPLSLEEAHPDKDGNAISLGGRDQDEWIEALEGALELIRVALPEWYSELVDTTVRIVPVGYEPEMHLSASYREAPGIVYMTLHPDPLTLAEALVHETQHGKLNLLTWVDPVLHNAYTEWTESPVRPDLRPIMGVLLAVHAFVPVAALHARLAAAGHPIAGTHRFGERRSEVMAGNAGGLAIVNEAAKPTKLGARVIEGLNTLHHRLASFGDSTAWDETALPPG